MVIKIALLVVFFSVMLGIGVYSRNKAKNVNDYVLGGRTVGPWISAFAFGTSYFSSVVFIGYAGQFGWKFGLASTWKCIYRKPSCMARSGTSYKTYDSEAGRKDHA